MVAGGVSLAVREHAPAVPSASTAVLVHGLASSARLWDGVAARLVRAGHPTVAVDLRGHGESDAPDTGYDTATAADDLIALIPHVSEAPVLLAGQSWGGNVVLQVAGRRPDLVAGLALVDGGWIHLAGRFDSWSDAEAQLTPSDIDGLPMADFRGYVAAALEDFPDGAVDAASSVVRELDDGTIRRRLTVPRHMQILRSMWADDPRRWYPLIQAPTVLMQASADETVAADVQLAADSIRRARVRRYPGAHHDLHLQRPDEVADDIRSLE
jgi:pimeloyl-ACP methyl ester carboxylesterase